MKTETPVLKRLAFVLTALVWCALNLQAQTAPTITTQPASQTNLVGSNVTFSVALSGTGPFSYQWQFDGTDLGDNSQITGSQSNVLTLASVTLGYSGTYEVLVTSLYGSTNASATLTVTQAPSTLYQEDFGAVAGHGAALTFAQIGWSQAVPSVNNSSAGIYFQANAVDANTGRPLPSSAAYYYGGASETGGFYTTNGGGSGTAGDSAFASIDPTLYSNLTFSVETQQSYQGPNLSSYFAVQVGGAWYASTPPMTAYMESAASTNFSLTTLNYNPLASGWNNLTVGSSAVSVGSTAASNLSGPITGIGIVVAVQSGGGSWDYNNLLISATAITPASPQISSQPTNQSVVVGGSASFAVAAIGFSPFGYQWQFDGTNLDGATNASLELNSVESTNAGGYDVVVTNLYASVTSAVATLTVALPPSILVQPAGAAVLPGSNATLRVTAAGLPAPYYSWFFDQTNLLQVGTNPTLIVSNFSILNAGGYNVIVTNAYGTATSSVANLTLAAPPIITSDLSNQTILNGKTVVFSVSVGATTGPFSYQWQFDGTNIPNNIITTVAGNGSGGYSGDGGPATNASLYFPEGVALDNVGDLYIADAENNRIRRVDTNDIITTVAGNGNSGYSGDGGAATNASLYFPPGAACDLSGNLYIADFDNNRIRQVATNGIITTVAGDGNYAYTGDGGTATSASLAYPYGVAIDAAGNLYIADYGNMRVRKVDTNGIISTVAGNGNSGYSGDGGVATNAILYNPYGVAPDAVGNLYIADSGNNRIRKVDTNGIISTVAGNGNSGYSGDGGAATNASISYPNGVAFDAYGDLYIADYGNNRIREVNTGGIITTIVGNGSASFGGDGGTAASASLQHPLNVALDAAGNLCIADWGNSRIRKVLMGVSSPSLTLSSVFTNYAGNYSVIITSPYGSVTSAVAALSVVLPPAILVQPASQVVLPGSNATFSVTATGTLPLYYSWYYDSTNLLQAGTNAALVVSNANTVNVGSYKVLITNAYAAVTSATASLIVAYPPIITSGPSNQTVLPGNNLVLTVSVGATPGPFTYQWQQNGINLPITNFTMSTIAGNGTAGYSGDGVSATNTRLDLPKSVAIDGAGNLYIADTSNSRLRKVGTNGTISTVLSGLNFPEGVAVDASGNIYIANTENNVILKLATNSIQTQVAGNGNTGYSGDGGAATSARLNLPQSVAVDASGNLYIADTGNNRIRRVGTNRVIATVAGNGTAGYFGDGASATNAGLSNPSVVAIDALGNLYIADTGNRCVREVLTNGIITTVAGNGTNGFAGNGSAAVQAELSNPAGLAFDAFGNLFIADTGNNRIRIVGTNGIIATIAGNGYAGYEGDGGAATGAELAAPSGLAFDNAGNLYIADTSNNRIRQASAGVPTLTLSSVSSLNAGNYTVVVTTPYGSVTSGVATLTVEAPPVITVQPASQVVIAGGSSMFSVEAAGSGSFGYLWYFAGTNLLQNSADNTLALANVSSNNAGNYTVVVTNTYGRATSQVATLSVVVTQPVSQAILTGASTTLSVAVVGSAPLGYQWQLNGTNLPNNNIITTVAGGGNLGDGGAATNARIFPWGAACDGAGNLYIADTFNNLIRRVDTNGNITTVAGNGSAGFSGDGGPATNASLALPFGVAVDTAGDLYIADTQNECIREVTTNGIINTIAGDGNFIYIGNGGDGGLATSATLDLPQSVAVDRAGNLYIADTSDNRIRKVGTNGIIRTVAGNGTAGYSGDGGTATNFELNLPEGVAVDAAGNLYVADTHNNRVRKVATNGIITTVAGNGTQGFSGNGVTATSAELDLPEGVAVDAAGNLYFADTYNNRIRKVATNGIITTLAGNGNESYSGDGGLASSASLFFPGGITLDTADNLYFADTYNNRIRKVATNNLITTIAGTNIPLNGIAATNASLYDPTGVTTDASGNLYVADANNQRIREVAFGGTITNIAGNGLAGYSGDHGAATNASLYPLTVALDALGNLYIADTDNNRIRKVAANGIITTVAGNGTYGSTGDGGAATSAELANPDGVASDAAGNLYIADSLNNKIRFVTTNGIITTLAGNGLSGYTGHGVPATSAELSDPRGVTLDAFGNLYIADTINHAVREVARNGIIRTVAGTGTAGFSGDGGSATNARLNFPEGLAVDDAGNLYIADQDNCRIRRVSASGIITTVAGTGTAGFSGDGGSATNARLDYPSGVALDTWGNLYLADDGNNRIREVHFAGLPTLTLTNVSAANAGNYTVIINNLYGSVTSVVATVTLASVSTPPAIISDDGSFGIVSNQFGFDLGAAVGQTIIIDGSSDLLNWTPLFTNMTTTSPFLFSDPNWTNFTSRFYRARLP